jgi:hypothetical protein
MLQPYAVLTDSHMLCLDIEGSERTIYSHKLARPLVHVGEVCAVANRLGVDRVWVAPGTDIDTGLSLHFVTVAHGPVWDTFAKYDEYADEKREVPTENARPVYARVWKKNTSGRDGRTVCVGFPPYDEWEWIIKTPEELLGTIHYLTIALEGKVSIQWGPGHVSTRLVAACNTGARASWVKESSVDLKTLPFQKSARDLIWKRATLLELSEGLYLHHVDKNSAYLAGCTGVQVGEGDPVHRVGDEITNAALPGIYRITYDPGQSVFDGGELPPVITTEWLTPDVITQARALGYTVTIHEAYQWDKKHRTLESWATALWNARTALHPKYGNHAMYSNADCRDNAYYTIKRIALIGVGKFASKKSHQFFRSDWWALVVGRARATLLRKLNLLQEKGYRPVLVYNDGLYFLSAEQDPEKAIPGITEKWDKLGGYKHEYTLQVDADMITEWKSRSPAKLVEYLNDRADYQEGGE